MERGKGDLISQTIVGPGNMLLSGGKAEHFGSQGQMQTVWKYLNFWKDCFSLPGIVLTAHGGGEGHACHKETATRSSVLAWRIPGTGEPGGLLSIGLHRVRHD